MTKKRANRRENADRARDTKKRMNGTYAFEMHSTASHDVNELSKLE